MSVLLEKKGIDSIPPWMDVVLIVSILGMTYIRFCKKNELNHVYTCMRIASIWTWVFMWVYVVLHR